MDDGMARWLSSIAVLWFTWAYLSHICSAYRLYRLRCLAIVLQEWTGQELRTNIASNGIDALHHARRAEKHSKRRQAEYAFFDREIVVKLILKLAAYLPYPLQMTPKDDSAVPAT